METWIIIHRILSHVTRRVRKDGDVNNVAIHNLSSYMQIIFGSKRESELAA